MACSPRPEDTGVRGFYVQVVLGTERAVSEFPEPCGLNHGLLLRDVLGPVAVRVAPVDATMARGDQAAAPSALHSGQRSTEPALRIFSTMYGWPQFSHAVSTGRSQVTKSQVG